MSSKTVLSIFLAMLLITGLYAQEGGENLAQ